MKIPIFPGKYHQNGEFSMAMLVYRRVNSLPALRIIYSQGLDQWLKVQRDPWRWWKTNGVREVNCHKNWVILVGGFPLEMKISNEKTHNKKYTHPLMIEFWGIKKEMISTPFPNLEVSVFFVQFLAFPKNLQNQCAIHGSKWIHGWDAISSVFFLLHFDWMILVDILRYRNYMILYYLEGNEVDSRTISWYGKIPKLGIFMELL